MTAPQLKFALMGNTTFTEQMGNGFIQSGIKCVHAFSNLKSDLPISTRGIHDWASKNEIPHDEVKDANSAEFKSFIENLQLDFVAVSWPKMITEAVISIPRLGFIGSHPTHLPFGRGRHPLHWLISMGIKSTYLSFFLLDDGVDSGDILLQLPIQVNQFDDINTLEQKINSAAFIGGNTIGIDLLTSQSISPTPQPRNIGSKWRKRESADIEIDCRMSCDAIVRLVRSITSPYECAILICKDSQIRIKEAERLTILLDDWYLHSVGTVINYSNSHVDLRADDGVVRLYFDLDQVQPFLLPDSLYPPSHYRK